MPLPVEARDLVACYLDYAFGEPEEDEELNWPSVAEEDGADSQNRTGDPLITNEMLYQLS